MANNDPTPDFSIYHKAELDAPAPCVFCARKTRRVCFGCAAQPMCGRACEYKAACEICRRARLATVPAYGLKLCAVLGAVPGHGLVRADFGFALCGPGEQGYLLRFWTCVFSTLKITVRTVDAWRALDDEDEMGRRILAVLDGHTAELLESRRRGWEEDYEADLEWLLDIARWIRQNLLVLRGGLPHRSNGLLLDGGDPGVETNVIWDMGHPVPTPVPLLVPIEDAPTVPPVSSAGRPPSVASRAVSVATMTTSATVAAEETPDTQRRGQRQRRPSVFLDPGKKTMGTSGT